MSQIIQLLIKELNLPDILCEIFRLSGTDNIYALKDLAQESYRQDLVATILDNLSNSTIKEYLKVRDGGEDVYKEEHKAKPLKFFYQTRTHVHNQGNSGFYS